MITYRENALTPEIINTIRASVGWALFSDAQLERAVRSTACSITAFSEGQPVGMARLIGDGVYWFLCDVAVVPAVQKQGIGRQMVQTLLDFAAQTLATGERCSVTLVSAQGKEDFYASFGFAAIPNDRAGHGMQLFLTA